MLSEDVQNSELLTNRNTTSKGKVQIYHDTAYKAERWHGQFRIIIDEVRGEKLWDWLKI